MKAHIPSVSSRVAAKLAIGASLLALGVVSGQPALAQGAEAQEADVESAEVGEAPAIVVTGTRIEGIAPVGSAVIPVSREEIERLGVSTTTDALRKLPQIVNFGGSNDQAGGSQIQNTSLNSFFAKAVNLRGLGSPATLSLVNGHRVSPQGANGQLFDADNIPGIALERIEVVADGGSAIYGSDAIAGVVNYILRRPENLIEAQARVGFADSVEEYIGSVALGHEWNTGGIFLAYEYQDRTALEAGDRPDLYDSDLSQYGGGLSPIFSNPGNVQFAPNAPAYGIPSGQDGTGLTLGDLTTSVNRQNQWLGSDAVPATDRHSVVGTLRQNLGDFVTFNFDGFFSKKSYVFQGQAVNATLLVPSNNPYSPCNPAAADDSAALDCPADGTLRVPYSFINDLGPQTNEGYEQLWSVSAGVDVELSSAWNANLVGYYSENHGESRNTDQINANGLNRALGAIVNGTAKPADVPFFNPFCDGSQFDCNADSTLALFSASTLLISDYELYGATASVSGSLFHIAGGDVKLAVGGEYHHDYLFGNGQYSNTRSNTVAEFGGIPVDNTREVVSAYAEVFVPLFGGENARSGLEELELSAAVRYDDYSDVGSTVNPKFGINYSPTPGLRFRGSYGTSFRAPTLVDVNQYATAGFLPRVNSGAAVGLDPANGSFSYLYPIGGNPNLKPETAETWSVGLELSPELIPNVNFAVTYYNILYEDKVDVAAYNAPIGAVLNSGQYDDFIVFNPVYFPDQATLTLDEFVDYYNTITADPRLPVLGVVDPQTLIAIVDARRNNSGVVKTDGLDIMFNLSIPGDWAEFRIGAQANYVFSYESSPVPAAPLIDQVNNFGYPARFAGKLELGIDMGGFSASAFVNHVNSRTITRDYLPAAVPDEYQNIDPYTTVDLTLGYRFEDTNSALTDGLGMSVSILNLFDADPPLVVNAGDRPIRFDPSYSSSLGRFISFQLSKKFR
jgi:iron complex outermembrane receptor protein